MMKKIRGPIRVFIVEGAKFPMMKFSGAVGNKE